MVVVFTLFRLALAVCLVLAVLEKFFHGRSWLFVLLCCVSTALLPGTKIDVKQLLSKLRRQGASDKRLWDLSERVERREVNTMDSLRQELQKLRTAD